MLSRGRAETISNETTTGGAVGMLTVNAVLKSFVLVGRLLPHATGTGTEFVGSAEQFGPWQGGFPGVGISASVSSSSCRTMT